MNNKFINTKTIVIVAIITMVFSCKKSLQNVQNIDARNNLPSGITDSVNLKYTDSGKIKANLKSKRMLDYSNRDFPYYEFIDGVSLDLFDENNNKNNVVADYAITYNSTGLIDLQGNVVLVTYSNDTLLADQLYYDQNKEWIFTNGPVQFKSTDYNLNGYGFDSNKSFSNAQVLEVDGNITVKE